MNYSSVCNAVFVKRPNRFLAHVLIDGKEEIVHVKNTGRCRELLQTQANVILEEAMNPSRKTRYSLISVYYDGELVNIDSQVPNQVVYQSILENKIKELPEVTSAKREVTYGNSRFDVAFETKEQKGFLEVKGVTLVKDGVAMFPDAPTQRGCKHIYELIHAVKEGYLGVILFLIQRKNVKYFTVNEVQDPAFAKALREARSMGVTILVYDSVVSRDAIELGKPVEVRL